MTQSLLQKITESYKKTDYPEFKVGDQLTVSIKIKEGEKERIQNFEGTVISYQRKNSINANFAVRKIASGIGVERTFFVHSPLVEKITVKARGKVRRAKLFYLRELSAKDSRIKRDKKRETTKKKTPAPVKATAQPVEETPTTTQEETVAAE
ncbi:MAG: 50S ribosomal protein L19 [bacterium]